MITFAYQSLNLQLKNPQLGNKNLLNFTRLSRSTSGGDLIVFRDDEWPSIETMTLSFDFCDEALTTKIKEFIKATLGKQFTYTDFNNVSWNTLITNPNTAITQTGINTYTISLELEVEQT
jgi:hypothetical protein